jgi:hypothetical protein
VVDGAVNSKQFACNRRFPAFTIRFGAYQVPNGSLYRPPYEKHLHLSQRPVSHVDTATPRFADYPRLPPNLSTTSGALGWLQRATRALFRADSLAVAASRERKRDTVREIISAWCRTSSSRRSRTD